MIGEHEHCWHDTGMVLTVNPPIYTDICCHCGEGRQRKSFVQWEPAGHGKYLPGHYNLMVSPDCPPASATQGTPDAAAQLPHTAPPGQTAKP